MVDRAAVPAAKSNLATRTLSALILIPVALAAIWAGGVVFTAGVLLIAGIAFWEWGTITAPDLPGWVRALGAAPILTGLALLSFGYFDLAIPLVAGPIVLAMLAAPFYPALGWLGAGMVYVALPGAGLISVRGIPEAGTVAVIVLCTIVWSTDSFAYFVGRSVGGIRLWPRVSPKKTWSGALGGVLASMVIGAFVSLFGYFGFGLGLLLAALLSIAAQAGDLLESAVKRRFNVKDSGNVIPGHGGLLDRVDGLFGAAVAAWLIAGTGIGGSLYAFPESLP